MALALTPGSEMRLDGAPDQELPYYLDRIQAIATRLVEEDEEGVLYGGDVRNAMEVAARMYQESLPPMAQMPGAAEALTPGQRSTRAMEAEQSAYQGYADQEMAGLRALGPRAGEATQAADMRRNMDDMPYSMEPTGFAIDDEQTLREEYTRRFGRPPRTPEEVQLARNLLVDEAQERMRGAGTWGAQVPFESEEHRDAYRARTPRQYSQEQADMMQVQGGGMGSPQGWVLVYHPATGRLTPMQRAPDPTVNDGTAISKQQEGLGIPVPGTSNRVTNNRRVGPGVDRLDVQPELRNPQMEAEGYIPKLMDGPQGPEWVYEKDAATQAEARNDLNNWQERQRRQRLASRSGLSAADAAEQIDAQYTAEDRPLSFEDRLRMQGDLARADEKKARQQRARQQAMMAGGQPTGGPFGTRATTTAINELGPGWREIALLDRLTNGRVGGPTPLGVDAVGAQNAMRFLNNEAIAGMDPLRRQMMEAQLDMQRRENNPAVAGQMDVAEGNFQTPEAVQHLDDLAERHDTTTGGFSYEDEMRLAQTLQDPPYNMSQADAEAKAYELAESRRWFSGSKPAGRQAGAMPSSPPRRASPDTPGDSPVRAPQGGGRGGRAASPPDWTRDRGPRGRGASRRR